MNLKDLLERSDYRCVQGDVDTEISSLVYDSRKIEEGSVFVCISGASGGRLTCLVSGDTQAFAKAAAAFLPGGLEGVSIEKT